MLDNSMRKAIDAVASGSFPVASARVICDSLRLEDPGCKVADRITAKNSCTFPRSNTNGLIQIPDDLCIRTRSVMKLPTRTCHSTRHLRSPSSEQFVCRKVMFKKFISPLNCHAHGTYDFIESIRMCWIERYIVVRRATPEAFIRQQPRLRSSAGCAERPDPEARL